MRNQFKTQRFRIFEDNNDIISIEKNNYILDIQELLAILNLYTKQDKHSITEYNVWIAFYGCILTGSQETESNPLFFGEVDSDGVFVESSPIYYLTSEDTSNSTLKVFLGSSTLTILHYSLLDSSLNIKLEPTNKESKALRDKAITQRERKQNQKQTKTTTSTATLCPILEDDNLKCFHGGTVKLESNLGKAFKPNGKSMILESDLLNSKIQGCPNPPTSGGPCKSVSVILPSARALKKYNDDYPIMQDLVSAGVLSDKGLPLTCAIKGNNFKIDSPNPTNAENITKEALLSQIKPTKPSLRLHYKIIPAQKDNLPIYRLKINEELLESNNKEALDKIEIDLKTQTKDLSNKELESILQESYAKDYEFKELTLQLDTTLASLIFLIPLKVPKVYKNALKDYEYKEYGIGRYQYIYKHCFCEDLQDFNSSSTSKSDARNDTLPSPLTHYTFVLHAPYQAQKLDLCIAQGIDSLIYQEDRQEEEDLDTPLYRLKMIICNGGHRENAWGGDIKNIDTSMLLASNDDSSALQSNPIKEKEKQIIEIYYSYGDDRIRLDDFSRHSQDINLHIKTQGYSEGETIEVKLESSSNQTFIAYGIIRNNEAIIMNVLKEIKEGKVKWE